MQWSEEGVSDLFVVVLPFLLSFGGKLSRLEGTPPPPPKIKQPCLEHNQKGIIHYERGILLRGPSPQSHIISPCVLYRHAFFLGGSTGFTESNSAFISSNLRQWVQSKNRVLPKRSKPTTSLARHREERSRHGLSAL
jgi:hypothetical protein